MSIKNLYSSEAKVKIKELAESIDFVFMATNLTSLPLHAIPMSTKKVDEMGNIWFLSGDESSHNSHIRADNKIHLFYGGGTDMEFLNVFGEAEIIRDRSIIHELYGSADDTWFDGKDDPKVTALMIKPLDVHYWDTKNGKLVSLLKMGVGAVTGKKMELGEEGKLEV